MGSPNTRHNRLFRSAHRLPIPSYSPLQVVEMVTSPLKVRTTDYLCPHPPLTSVSQTPAGHIPRSTTPMRR
jgi:hypothetical protein